MQPSILLASSVCLPLDKRRYKVLIELRVFLGLEFFKTCIREIKDYERFKDIQVA